MITVLPVPAPPNIRSCPLTSGSSRSITLIPVMKISFCASTSSNGGGWRWIGQRSSTWIESAGTSSGSPQTLMMWPRVTFPTGTEIG